MGLPLSSRSRSVLVALALGAATAAIPLPAVGAVAGGLAEGRDAAPVVVSVGAESAAHWMPGQRRRKPVSPPLRSSLTSTVTSIPITSPSVTTPAVTAPVAPVAPAAAADTAPAQAAAAAAPNLAPQHATSYSFMAEDTPGTPIRWNPCTTIHWVFNPANAPTGGFTAVQSAIARVASATGLSFTYDGTTTSTPTSSYLDAQTSASGFRPVLVGWSTPAASSLLANQPASLVGMDQTIWARPANGATYIVSGVVALNADVTARTTGGNSWFTFALHEVGHAVGLGHTSDSTQIMAPTIPAAATDYGSGDLAGLAKVGGSC